MRHYQTVIILKPDLDEGHVDQAVEKLTELLEKCDGKDTRLEKWGKKRLAYRIKKNKFGYYLNWFHTCDPLRVADFEKELQLYDLVIKYMVIRLEEKDLERVLKSTEESANEEASGEGEAEGEKTAEKTEPEKKEESEAKEQPERKEEETKASA